MTPAIMGVDWWLDFALLIGAVLPGKRITNSKEKRKVQTNFGNKITNNEKIKEKTEW